MSMLIEIPPGSMVHREGEGHPKLLWEKAHPYYCSEAEYHTGDLNGENFGRDDFDSWTDFLDEWGNSSPHLNLVFRWDWHTKEQLEDDCEEKVESDLLEIFFVLQREGLFRPCHIKVTRDDEPAVRAWLIERSKTILSFWSFDGTD